MNVTQATYDAFRDAVFLKHRKLRGSLQEEADAALLAHLPRLGQANGHLPPKIAQSPSPQQEGFKTGTAPDR